MTANIERFIDHLFYTKGSITLDGIGTISLERVPAVITPNQEEILPPKSVFHFSDEEINPHQLKELIIESEGISSEKADSIVDEYTQDILNKLINYNIVKISDIGYLESNDKGITFTASQQSLDQAYYGLPILPLNPISKGSVSDGGNMIMLTKTIDDRGNHEWLNYLGALLLGASMILAYHYLIEPFPYALNGTADIEASTEVKDQLVEANNSDKKQPPVAEDEPVDVEENEPSDIESDISSSGVEVDNAGGEDTSNVILAKPSSDTECVIIIGVFTRTINALELSDKLREDGFKPYLENINDTQRVGISFKCADHDLEVMINNIRNRYNKKAWYLVPQISI